VDASVQWWCADGRGRQEGRKRNTKAGTDADMLDEQGDYFRNYRNAYEL
jgi:hypothetical protein